MELGTTHITVNPRGEATPVYSPQAILGAKIQEKDSRPISLGV